ETHVPDDVIGISRRHRPAGPGESQAPAKAQVAAEEELDRARGSHRISREYGWGGGHGVAEAGVRDRGALRDAGIACDGVAAIQVEAEAEVHDRGNEAALRGGARKVRLLDDRPILEVV